MKLLPRVLARSGIAARLLARDPAVLGLFAGDPASPSHYGRKAQEVDRRFDAVERAEAARSLLGGGPGGPERIARFVENAGYMVTTGQQPGLFGGPLFGLYKALTAAALARRLERTLGRPVLPVFWIASEDHDWEEARSARLLDVRNELRDVALAPRDGLSRSLHRIPLGPEIGRVLDEFLAHLPDTEFTPAWASVLRGAYVPGATLPGAYGAVMEALLGPAGVFLVQAHDGALKRRSLPILLRELAGSEERTRDLAARSRAIEALGESAQVPIQDGATNLLLDGPDGRERVLREGKGFRLRASGRSLTSGEVEAAATADPSILTPNVLLRPVVEAALLPTLAYVGGPAETAYLAQVEPIFRAHGVEPPLVHPRGSFAVLETKISKVLDKFSLDPDDFALPPEELTARLLRGTLPPAVGDAVRDLRQGLARGLEGLGPAVKALDPTLVGAVESFGSQSGALVHELERKILASLKRENDVALSQVEKARVNLFPQGKPQERVLGPFQYLVRYGAAFLSAAEEAAKGAVLPPPEPEA